MRKTTIVTSLVLITLLHGVQVTEGAIVKSGKFDDFKVKVVSDYQSRGEGTWEKVPGLTFLFLNGNAGPIQVSVCSETHGSGTDLFLRALIDGKVLPPDWGDGGIKFNGANGESAGRCFRWLKPNLDSGEHRVKIQWRTGVGWTASPAAVMRNSSLLVQW